MKEITASDKLDRDIRESLHARCRTREAERLNTATFRAADAHVRRSSYEIVIADTGVYDAGHHERRRIDVRKGILSEPSTGKRK